MTQPDLFQLGPRPPGEPSAPASLANVVGGALFVAVVVVGSSLVFRLARGATGEGPSVTYEAYYPEAVAVKIGSSVMLAGQAVGRVESIVAGMVGVQLQVFPGRLPETPEVRTLTAPPQSITVPSAGLEVRVREANDGAFQIGVSWAGTQGSALMVLAGQRDGSWRLDSVMQADSLDVNGRVRALARGAVFHPGDLLTLGDAALEIGPVSVLTRVRVSVDTTSFLVAAKAVGGNGAGPARAVGPGSTLSINGGGLGLGSATLEIAPSYRPPDARVLPAAAELVPRASRDPLQVLAGMANYLTSPAALNAPPNNRFQHVVADLNAAMTGLRDVTGAMRTQARRGDGAGSLGRLMFDPGSMADIDSLWSRLADAGGTVRALAGTLQKGGSNLDSLLATFARAAKGDPTAQGVMLRLLAARNIDTTLANIEQLSADARDIVTGLNKGHRSALGLALGDKEAEALRSRVDSLLNGMGDTGRVAALGVIGLLVVEILSGLFF